MESLNIIYATNLLNEVLYPESHIVAHESESEGDEDERQNITELTAVRRSKVAKPIEQPCTVIQDSDTNSPSLLIATENSAAKEINELITENPKIPPKFDVIVID
jgi:hypothetical protein